MQTGFNLTNHFLIAMPALNDPNFFHTVTYICEHTSNGAMGIVINRPTDMQLSEIFEHMKIAGSSEKPSHMPVYFGGPVEEDRGFILHHFDKNWDSTMQITENLAISTSRDILEAIAHDEGPDKALVALGFAGWGAGQLEREMSENSWISGPADDAIIFDIANEERWQQAARHIGIDLNLLTSEAGHA